MAIRTITPSEALTKLKGFNERIDRLQSNEYNNPRFRTADLNRLKHELRTVVWCNSIAVHSKNKERASEILEAASKNYMIAFKIRDKEIFGAG